MKILAVDDDASIRDLLPMILAEAGITDVTVAGSAQAALSVISEQAEPFECFLLDIQMPGGDGIELCGAIRELPDHAKTPIIMLTAMHEKSFIDAAFAAGATDYVTKPFDLPEVCARVRMAKLLVDEQRQVKKLSHETSKASEDNCVQAFATAKEITGVKGLISRQSFDNYLAQLSRAGTQSSTFFAVHVLNCQPIFNRSTSSEFDYAVRHIADAIMAVPELGTVVVLYSGSGNFICCSNSANLDATERLETDIQNVLDDKELTYDDGSSLDVEIAVGTAVQPMLSEPLQLEFLEPQAINRAMARVEQKRTARAMPNIRRIS